MQAWDHFLYNEKNNHKWDRSLHVLKGSFGKAINEFSNFFIKPQEYNFLHTHLFTYIGYCIVYNTENKYMCKPTLKTNKQTKKWRKFILAGPWSRLHLQPVWALAIFLRDLCRCVRISGWQVLVLCKRTACLCLSTGYGLNLKKGDWPNSLSLYHSHTHTHKHTHTTHQHTHTHTYIDKIAWPANLMDDSGCIKISSIRLRDFG